MTEERQKDTNWRRREAGRMCARVQPVWVEEEFWQSHPEIHKDHYLHVSPADRALLAYTQSPEKGERDIQTPIKPGRYLAKFFSGILTEKQIKTYADWQTTGAKTSIYDDPKRCELRFARTQEEIVEVYRAGPGSCMKNFPAETHPARVYAAGDLELAYFVLTQESGEQKIVARALVRPETKQVGRVYPTPYDYRQMDGFASPEDAEDCQNALRNRLRAEGYEAPDCYNGQFEGVRLLKIMQGDNYLMPYLDYDHGVDDDGEFWVMGHNDDTEHNCSGTHGLLFAGPICDHCQEPDDSDDLRRVATSFCGGRPTDYRDWCPSCRENDAFFCEGFHEDVDSAASDEVLLNDGRTVCEVWAAENATYSNHTNEWFIGESVEMENSETWSTEEFDEDGFVCAVTGNNVPRDEEHPEHPGVWQDVNEDELAEWLSKRFDNQNANQIANQGELALKRERRGESLDGFDPSLFLEHAA